jgi:hypothetical protein
LYAATARLRDAGINSMLLFGDAKSRADGF